MTTPPPIPPQREHSGTKASKVKAIVITLVASALLAGGSCFGFLGTAGVSRDRPLSAIFGIGFGVGVLAFIGACVWAAVAFFVYFFGSNKGES